MVTVIEEANSVEKRVTARSRFTLPRDLQKRGAALMHQQCWCWGQDVKHHPGNVLMTYGFARHRIPARASAEGERGCTAYQLRLPCERRLVLWGFGFYYGEQSRGGIFIGRYQFRPQVLEPSRLPLPIWKPEQLPPLRFSNTKEEFRRTLQMLTSALQLIADYEFWVKETLGIGHRRQTLIEWQDKIQIAADVISTEWRQLAIDCERLLTTHRAFGSRPKVD